MPSSVDNRAVEMKFDNVAFEKNIGDTLLSLDHLKKKLDFANEQKSLSNLKSAGKKFELNSIGQAVDTIATKFSAMGVVAFTTLNNIVTRAVDAGINLAHALSLDQIKGGFDEYETNMNSIQTILANTAAKGSTLTEVNAALDELNAYSDKTIYNFAEMARNIGTFTAAGVDLKTSTQSIKGIANLAAVSGSSSEQASTAMYQLSQAIASGTVRLMDWNSVSNAGMGGAIFQKALFETGKALGTIKNIDMKTTFEEWTSGGNSFRTTLEQGWLTTDVLTKTLAGFTGDLTEAQIMSMGYSKEQAAEILKMGVIAGDAAQKVKTLHQLINTVGEAVGSGWSESFRIMIGDFDEARTLFTSINDAIGKFVSKSADARNSILQEWKDMGGRELLIMALKTGFKNLAAIIAPVHKAFRTIFPKATAETLWNMTRALSRFTTKLKIGPKTAIDLQSAFRGFFSVLDIGWEIIKGVAGLLGDLFAHFKGTGGNVLSFASSLGSSLTALHNRLVTLGGLKAIFAKISRFIQDPIPYLMRLKELFMDFLHGGKIPGINIATTALGRLKKRFEGLQSFLSGVSDKWDSFSSWVSKIRTNLDGVWTYIKTWFSDLGSKLSTTLSTGDFNSTLDVINTGLLGGIVALFAKLTHGGFKFDFGNIGQSVTKGMQALTDTLNDMQTKLKSDILIKIATAIGILTASVLVLSLIDSVALTKALTAMAVGFGELIGSMALLTKVASGPKGAATLATLATGMVIMAGSILILAGAATILSKLDWNELAKGLGGVSVLMGVMVSSMKLLSKNVSGTIGTSIAVGIMAVALNILALAVKSFADLDFGELSRGLVGTAIGLGLMVLAMKQMPKVSQVDNAFGLIAMAAALNLLALAVKSFGEMNWADLAKGLAGVAGGLLLLTLAMNSMPSTTGQLADGVAMLAIAGALNLMAMAMKSIATMSWGQIAKSLVGLAGALTILSIAVNTMDGALLGAVSIAVVSGALLFLSHVLKEFAKLGFKELGMGLLGIASVLGVLGLAAFAMAPVIPALLALSVAMLALGAGFALFGVGASLTAKAFDILVKTGKTGVSILLSILEGFVKKLPEIAKALAQGLISFVESFLESAPVLIDSLRVILIKLLDTVIELAPKLAETIITLIDSFLKVVVEKTPDVVAAGFAVLMGFLKGIRDNIGEIVTVVVDIVTNFLDALAAKVPQIIDSVFNLVQAIITGVIGKLVDIGQWLIPKGLELLGGLLTGIGNKLSDLWTWFKELPGKIKDWLSDAANWLLGTGLSVMQGLWDGFKDKLENIMDWVKGLPGKVLGWLSDAGDTLLNVGKDIMNGLWDGLKAVWEEVKSWLSSITDIIPDWKGPPKRDKVLLYKNGTLIMGGLLNGMRKGWAESTVWLSSLDPGTIVDFNVGSTMEGLSSRASTKLGKTLDAIYGAIGKIEEFNPTITPVLDLSEVEKSASKFNDILDQSPISANLSFNQAGALWKATQSKETTILPASSAPTEIHFQQINNSPEALNVNAIYKNTRSQINSMKQELHIP